MEREVGEGRGKREGGGEKKRGRRGIIVGGMVIGLLMGCNNGIAELEKKNQFLSSVVSLGNDFLDVFTSFGEMVGGVLGFNATTKKSDVGAYFKKIQDTVQGTKDKLNEIINNMEKEGNPNAANAKGAVNKLVSEKLDKIIDGAKKASEAIGTENDLLGNVIAANGTPGNAKGVAGTKVNELVEGLKAIVEVVLGDKGGDDVGDDKQADTLSARGDAGAVKLFDGITGTSTSGKTVAADSVKAVGAITGAAILQAMVKDGGAAKLAKNSSAIAGVANNAKDATIAGGIALRAMAKDGKFANGDTSNDANAVVKGAALCFLV